MRKIFAMLMCFFLMAPMCACSAAPVKPVDIVFAFTGNVQLKIGDSEAACTIMRAAPQSANITIQSPKELSGLSYTWGDSFTSAYAGITNKSENCNLPQNSFASLIIHVLDAAERPDALYRVSDSSFSGNADAVSYVLTVDHSSGFIQKIEIPRYQICAVFTQCQKII